MIQFTCTVTYSVHARILGGEKNDPCLSPSAIFLLYNTQSVDLVPAEEPVQSQADAYPVVMALVVPQWCRQGQCHRIAP